MARGLGIGLGIDFTQFNKDLNTVADRIESAGKNTSVKIGSLAGDIAGGKLSGADIGASVEQIGVRLSSGMASGIRSASAAMLGFTAHVDKMLDRLVGSAVTIFRRIDSAMKFPAFDAFFKTAQLRLSNFSALWRKPLSDLDIAVGGGFGGMIQHIAKIMKALIDGLASSISGALKSAVADIAAQFASVNQGIVKSEASAAALVGEINQASEATSRFAKFADQASTGLRSSKPGPKIGAGTNFNAPSPAKTPTLGFGDPGRGPIAGGMKELGAAVGFTIGSLETLGSVSAKVGAALVSVPLRGYIAFSRLANFLGGLGDVGKKSYRQLYESHGLLAGSILGVTKAVGGLARSLFNIGTLGIFRKASGDAQAFGGSVKTAQTSVGQLGSVVANLGGQIAAAFGVVGVIYKTVQFLRDGVKNASDLNEEASRSQVVFGQSFGAVEAQAKRMAVAFGVSRKEQLGVASGFGAMAQGAGFSEAASADLANQLTKMAADLSSSVNIPFEEAGQKIRSALAGEAEPLRQFGANITETNVKAYAMANGIAKAGGEMSDQAKITARAALIMQGLSYAQGDLERTSDSAANQFRKAGGGLEEFGIRIGELLLPAINLGTQAFNEFLAVTLDVLDQSRSTLESWASSVSDVMGFVGKVVRNAGSYWKVAQLQAGAFVINTIAWIETIPKNWGPITEWIGRNWFNMLKDLGNMMSAAFQNMGSNAKRFGEALWTAIKGGGFEFTWTPLLDGFKAATEQLPELVKPKLISVKAAVDEVFQEIDRKEQARAAAMAKPGVAMKKPPGAAAAEKATEYKIGGALEVGSKEAFSAISRGLAGQGQKDAVKEGVVVQKDIAKKVGEHLEWVKAHPPILGLGVK